MLIILINYLYLQKCYFAVIILINVLPNSKFLYNLSVKALLLIVMNYSMNHIESHYEYHNIIITDSGSSKSS